MKQDRSSGMMNHRIGAVGQHFVGGREGRWEFACRVCLSFTVRWDPHEPVSSQAASVVVAGFGSRLRRLCALIYPVNWPGRIWMRFVEQFMEFDAAMQRGMKWVVKLAELI